MVRLALLMLGDRASAEDAVQESFTAVYRRWDKMQTRCHFRCLEHSLLYVVRGRCS